jgi:hypothetical protein
MHEKPFTLHIPSCTTTKSNLYLIVLFNAVTSEPALYKFRMFHVPKLMTIFQLFSNKAVFMVMDLLAQRPTPKLEDHSLSFVHGYLFNVFAATLHSWRLSLLPQPEDEPANVRYDSLMDERNIHLIHGSHSPFRRKRYIHLLAWCQLLYSH